MSRFDLLPLALRPLDTTIQLCPSPSAPSSRRGTNWPLPPGDGRAAAASARDPTLGSGSVALDRREEFRLADSATAAADAPPPLLAEAGAAGAPLVPVAGTGAEAAAASDAADAAAVSRWAEEAACEPTGRSAADAGAVGAAAAGCAAEAAANEEAASRGVLATEAASGEEGGVETRSLSATVPAGPVVSVLLVTAERPSEFPEAASVKQTVRTPLGVERPAGAWPEPLALLLLLLSAPPACCCPCCCCCSSDELRRDEHERDVLSVSAGDVDDPPLSTPLSPPTPAASA